MVGSLCDDTLNDITSNDASQISLNSIEDMNDNENNDVNRDMDRENCYEHLQDPLQILKSLKLKYCDNIKIAQLNINSICNKIDQLRTIVQGYVDILRL